MTDEYAMLPYDFGDALRAYLKAKSAGFMGEIKMYFEIAFDLTTDFSEIESLLFYTPEFSSYEKLTLEKLIENSQNQDNIDHIRSEYITYLEDYNLIDALNKKSVSLVTNIFECEELVKNNPLAIRKMILLANNENDLKILEKYIPTL